MTMRQSVFIDGVGRVKDFETDGSPTIKIPVNVRRLGYIEAKSKRESMALAETVMYAAVFNRVGTLSDGRIVYTYEGKAILWKFSIFVTDELRRTSPINVADEKLAEFLSQTGRPCAVLYRASEREGMGTRHHFEGVGVRMVA